MDLRPFESTYAATVASWPSSAREVSMWCGRQDFPFPAEVVTGWQRSDDVQGHLLFVRAEPVGYGELWLDDEEDEIELARIIVAPAMRGRGIGQELVRRLTGLALASDHTDVFMRVHPENEPALRCYRRAGFGPVDEHLAAEWNAPQPIAYVWLQHVEQP
jgi:[ribosomal protein S18]-alanine N-acetyltransferase